MFLLESVLSSNDSQREPSFVTTGSRVLVVSQLGSGGLKLLAHKADSKNSGPDLTQALLYKYEAGNTEEESSETLAHSRRVAIVCFSLFDDPC